MMPTLVKEAAPVLPTAYHRAQARLGPALHFDALTPLSYVRSQEVFMFLALPIF